MAARPAAAQVALDRVAPALRPPDQTPQPPAPDPSADIAIEPPGVSAAPESTGAVMVGAISLTGLTALAPSEFSDLLVEYVGRSLQSSELATLTDRIAARARARGYAFAVARISPQRLAAGVLTVEVDEGRIDRVDVTGSDSPAIRAALAPLATGKPVRIDDVERRLLIVGDMEGVRVRQARFVREGTRGVLIVAVSSDRVSLRVALRDDGTRPVGPVQLHIDAMVAALFSADDSLSVNYTTAPLEPKELQYARIRYQKQISASGTTLSFTSTYSTIQPGAYLSDLNILGRSWSQSVGLLQPLYRRRRSSLWLNGSFEVSSLTQRRGGTLVRRDRESVARIGIYGYEEALGGRLRISAVVSQGLGLFDATESGDPLASRSDGDGTFTSANFWVEWTRRLGSGFSVRLAENSQIASEPLLIGEEVALGGGAFLRGYDWSERSGDTGVMGSAELRYDIKRPLGIADRAQFYAFGDGGVVRNLLNGFGGGSLASTGGGVRIDFSRSIGATAEVAVPVTGPRYDTGNREPRINIGLSSSF